MERKPIKKDKVTLPEIPETFLNVDQVCNEFQLVGTTVVPFPVTVADIFSAVVPFTDAIVIVKPAQIPGSLPVEGSSCNRSPGDVPKVALVI